MGIEGLASAEWLNAPPDWRLGEALEVTTGDKTDFWQSTFYGFRRDDGHALLVSAPPEFTAEVAFGGDYEVLYDQAGLLLRIDAGTWIKAGVEVSDGVTNLSVVVTRQGRSDWSVCAEPGAAGAQRLRMVRKGGAVLVHAWRPGGHWQHLRLADFPEGSARIGPMACSPQRAGFTCRFTEFRLGPPLEQPLH